MKVRLDPGGALAADVDVSIVGVPEAPGKDPAFPSSLAAADAAVAGAIQRGWASGEFRGQFQELSVFHRTEKAGRIAILGLGARDRLDAERIRRASASAVKGVRGKGVRRVAFHLASFTGRSVSPEVAVRALTDGIGLGSYEFVRYKAPKEPLLEEGTICLGSEHRAQARTLGRAFAQEQSLIETVRWTREIANLPANEAHPSRLASEAEALARAEHLKVTVYDEKELARLGCGGHLAVGGGSAHPPRMIVLEYPGAGAKIPTIAIVGKGITFDSGGISIKPSLKMGDMKFDKSGAVAVLGILRAAAQLRVRPRVIGVMACAENVPSGTSYRPGDVVTAYGGSTIEIANTDAEGRVVLADALAFVVDQFHPDAVVDLATLTGAQVVALGDDTAGLLSNNDRLAARILAASKATGEPVWRMPLTDYHRELVKSEVADVRNSIEIPLAGMLTAGAFLEHFAGAGPWAHLDIAGAAYTTITTRRLQPAYQGIGATAFGVRLVTRFLIDYAR